ncbi:MAG: Crossover junction endodeoxyribonuclease RuvC [Alphaproteobacteria bacterium MarineAlpha9_Bin7]|nr:MAG: Crossover junction endodeoxyribonuclease RuvC [Alphaproteobacteria bacterium MarineAlpha9_Bin7]
MNVRLIGLDPGLRKTGWGIVDFDGSRLSYVACGAISTPMSMAMAGRLAVLYGGLAEIIETWKPNSAAVEETFVNKNASSALKLGQARGVVLLAPALAGLDVAEYHNRAVKLAVVGTGRAEKQQISTMVRHLLPTADPQSADAADALAVAICHAHHTCDRELRALGGALI